MEKYNGNVLQKYNSNILNGYKEYSDFNQKNKLHKDFQSFASYSPFFETVEHQLKDRRVLFSISVDPTHPMHKSFDFMQKRGRVITSYELAEANLQRRSNDFITGFTSEAFIFRENSETIISRVNPLIEKKELAKFSY